MTFLVSLKFEPSIEIVLSIEISLGPECTNITMSCTLDLIMTPYFTHFMRQPVSETFGAGFLYSIYNVDSTCLEGTVLV